MNLSIHLFVYSLVSPVTDSPAHLSSSLFTSEWKKLLTSCHPYRWLVLPLPVNSWEIIWSNICHLASQALPPLPITLLWFSFLFWHKLYKTLFPLPLYYCLSICLMFPKTKALSTIFVLNKDGGQLMYSFRSSGFFSFQSALEYFMLREASMRLQLSTLDILCTKKLFTTHSFMKNLFSPSLWFG